MNSITSAPGLGRQLASQGVAFSTEIAGAAARFGLDPRLLAAVAAQETGGPGTAQTIEHGYVADAALVVEPTGLIVNPVEGGLEWLRVVVRGVSGHTAYRFKTVHAGGQGVAVNEKSRVHAVHAYERLKLFEEQWLLRSAEEVEVVIIRPARVFGAGEDWILPRLMESLVKGRVWLPGGGRAKQTFVSAADVGRACLAASDRGRPGHSYLVGGFDSSWRELLESAIRAVGLGGTIVNLPYDFMYMRALAIEAATAAAWEADESAALGVGAMSSSRCLRTKVRGLRSAKSKSPTVSPSSAFKSLCAAWAIPRS